MEHHAKTVVVMDTLIRDTAQAVVVVLATIAAGQVTLTTKCARHVAGIGYERYWDPCTVCSSTR